MAILQCPECGKNVSSSALACPSCGFPLLASRIKSQIKTFPLVIRDCLKLFRKMLFAFLNVIARGVPYALKISFFVTILVFVKNIYFLSHLEEQVVRKCSAAVGSQIFDDYGKVDVPGDIEWSSVENRVGEFYDLSHFDLSPPYMRAYIDVIGYDSKYNEWVCTPEFSTSDSFTLNPYKFYGFFRVRIKG